MKIEGTEEKTKEGKSKKKTYQKRKKFMESSQ